MKFNFNKSIAHRFILSLLLFCSLGVLAQPSSLPVSTDFGTGSSYSSSTYFSTIQGTRTQGATFSCSGYAYEYTSLNQYFTTKTATVSPGKGVRLSFTLRHNGSFTSPEIYLRVGDAAIFSPSTSVANYGWVKLNTNLSSSTTTCVTNTVDIPNDIVGGQRFSISMMFKNGSTNWVAIDDWSMSEINGTVPVPTNPYTENFNSTAWYPSSGYVSIPYHSYYYLSTGATAYLFSGGVTTNYAALGDGSMDITPATYTRIQTKEINTSAYTNGELSFAFKGAYPCPGGDGYTFDETYTSYAPEVYIMAGQDNATTQTWTKLPVNMYFANTEWNYASISIAGYKNQSVKIKFQATASNCLGALQGIDNIKVLDRNCTVSGRTAKPISGSTNPSANTNYTYTTDTITNATYYKWYVRSGGNLYSASPYIVSGQGTTSAVINFGSLPTPLRVLCIPYDANPASNTDACYAKIAYLSMTSCTAPVIASADSVKPTTCSGTDGSIKLNGLTASTSYAVTYNKNGNAVASANYTTDANGVLTISGLSAGDYTNFVVTLNSCSSVAFPASGAISISDPTSGNVANPVFNLGATSSRCAVAGTVTYTATATNSTGITYTLDATSLNAGNTINASTGAVTYLAGYAGTATITASATGCGGPKTTTHTVTITATASTPVFNLGATSTRCQSAGTVTYTATATNSTAITYSLDATSLNAGNTINPNTGAVTYVAGYTGTATITATATGCGNPVNGTHTVTITATVTAPVFNLGATTSRCAVAGPVTYTATSSNIITYTLDATSLNAGNTINASTGTVTYVSGYAGTAVITASITDCSGTKSATHTVTITAVVGIPSFTQGATSTRCQAAGTLTYTATAANSTSIIYSLDATSLNAGNTINANTGAVTFVAGYTGTAVITATATGCPANAVGTHTVTITPSVATPVFSNGSSVSRCQGAGTTLYTATAANSTAITYSLDVAAINAGNSIVAGTGALTFAANYTGTITVTASAAGCNGPGTATLTIIVSAPAGTPVFTAGNTSIRCQGAGTATYSATAANSSSITYSLDQTSINGGNTINAGTGQVTFAANYTGTTVVTALAAGCSTPTTATHIITTNAPVAAPVFGVGSTTTRCQAAAQVFYTATATGSTGITYSLDQASINAGNTINAATAEVNWAGGYNGIAVITATAAGCNGPKSSTLTVTVNPPVGVPVFNAGASTSRCQGVGTNTYTATATNSTGITYSLDFPSLAAGNTINSTTGQVVWVAGYSGTATITASAAGCGNGVTANHTVVVNPSVGIPVFSLSSSSASRCIGPASNATYSASATNSTSITYSLDANALNAGNTINVATGDVRWVLNFTGTATITATAFGCNGPSVNTYTVTFNSPAGTPVFAAGASSSRCQAAGTLAYTATATNSPGIIYRLDQDALTAGNTIDSLTGNVNWIAGYNGTATITAIATGCGTPTSTHVVTVTPVVTNPVFNMGATSTRCMSAGTVTYAANSTNNTGLTYSLDATSLSAGNTINTITGAVTWAANYTGRTIITATATGCGGPVTATHSVTVTDAAVGSPVFSLGATSNRCAGISTQVYNATADNSSSITYSLDATSLNAGNTINAATGEITWAANYTGTSTITASADGCSGLKTSTHTVSVVNSVLPTINITANPGNSVCVGTPVTYTAQITNGGANPAYVWKKNTNTVGTGATYTDAAPANGDVITATLTSDASCASQSTVTSPALNMIVKQTPAKPIGSASTPICEDEALQLNTQQVGSASYSWTGPGGYTSSLQNPVINNTTPANSGIYTIAVTVNGCTSPADTLNVLVRAKPVTPGVTQSHDTLTSSPAQTYQWFFGAEPITGATSQKIVVTESGFYSVQITDANGCKAKSVMFSIKLTGIDELAASSALSIYPNPASGSVEISVSPELIGVPYEIYNVSGQKLAHAQITRAKQRIDVSVFAPGIYFIKVGEQVKKLVKE